MTEQKPVESLLLGFSKNSQGDAVILVVGRRIGNDVLPINMLQGDRVVELYKELTGHDLKI